MTPMQRIAFVALMLASACGSGLYATTPAETATYNRCREMIRVTQCPGPPGGFAALCAFQKWEEHENTPPAMRPAWLIQHGCPAPMVEPMPAPVAGPPAPAPAPPTRAPAVAFAPDPVLVPVSSAPSGLGAGLQAQ